MTDQVTKNVETLKKNGLKVTSARLEVMKYLERSNHHPTADEIYTALKKKNPSLSKTTVYNILETLRMHDIIQVLTISKSEQRYEFGNKMHHHFLCKKCGNITDIDIECPFLHGMLKGEHKVEEVHGYFKGICKKCLRKKGG
jgi:Fe2+ or Zn2+ uptake regulation protein